MKINKMVRCLLLLFFTLVSLQSFCQELVYKSNGNITDANGTRISPAKMRELLSENLRILANYNEGRSKKTAGNILLISGLGLLTADVVQGVTASGVSATPVGGGQYAIQDEKNNYPSVLTYLGVAAILIAIPVKIGFSKKIRTVVTDYNNQKNLGLHSSNNQKMEFITTSNGIGLRLTLN